MSIENNNWDDHCRQWLNQTKRISQTQYCANNNLDLKLFRSHLKKYKIQLEIEQDKIKKDKVNHKIKDFIFVIFIPILGIVLSVAFHVINTIKDDNITEMSENGMTVYLNMSADDVDELNLDPGYKKNMIKAINLQNRGEYEKAFTVLKAITQDFQNLDSEKYLIYSMLANDHYRKNELSLALEAYNMALAINNDYPIALNNKGLILQKIDNMEEQSIDAFNLAIEKDSQFWPAWSNLGVSQMMLNRYTEAFDSFSKAISIEKENSLLFYNQGLAQLCLANYDQAILSYEKALIYNKKKRIIQDSEILYKIGESYEGNQNLNQALEYYDEAIKSDGSNTQFLSAKGRVLRELGEIQDSVDCYNKAIVIDGSNSDLYYNRGLSQVLLRQNDAAHNSFSQAIKYNNKNETAWQEDGNLFFQEKKWDEAIICYDNVVTLNPKNKDSWFKMGFILSKRDKYIEAIECFDKVTEIDSGYKEAWYEKGVLYAKEKKEDNATFCLDQAITIDPDYLAAWLQKGNFYFSINKKALALESFTEVTDRDRTNTQAWFKKGEIYSEEKRYSEAYACFHTVTEITPDDADAWVGQAQSIYGIGDLREAMTLCEKALEIDSENESASALKQKILIELQSPISTPASNIDNTIYYADYNSDTDIIAESSRLKITLKHYYKDKVISVIEEQKYAITAISISKDGSIIASGNENGDINLWKINNGKCINTISKAFNGPITSISFNNDGKQIVATGKEKKIKIWNLFTGILLNEITKHNNTVSAVIFSHDGNNLYLCVEENNSINKIYLWNISSEKYEKKYTGEKKGIHSMSLNNRGDQIITRGDDNNIYIWYLKKDTVESMKVKGDKIYSIGFDKQNAIHCSIHKQTRDIGEGSIQIMLLIFKPDTKGSIL